MLAALTSIVLAAEARVNDKADLYPHWQELVVGALAFAILFFFMWKWVIPQVNTLLEERSQKIQGEIEKAEQVVLDALNGKLTSVNSNLGYASRAWRAVKEAASDTMAFFGSIGAKDPTEKVNLAVRHSDLVKELKKKLDAWWKPE